MILVSMTDDVLRWITFYLPLLLIWLFDGGVYFAIGRALKVAPSMAGQARFLRLLSDPRVMQHGLPLASAFANTSWCLVLFGFGP